MTMNRFTSVCPNVIKHLDPGISRICYVNPVSQNGYAGRHEELSGIFSKPAKAKQKLTTHCVNLDSIEY